MEGEENQNEE
jgi:hypothetical protein